MAVLVIAEHDNASLKPATLNAVTAAKELSDDIHVLVAGHQADAAAKEAAAVAGVTKVLHAESEAQAHPLAENLAPLIVELAGNYSHVIATATTTMKNVMPRAAALLDVAQISDASAIVSEDTFVRPIYAGNALATVQTSDKIKLVTIRGTAFKAARGHRRFGRDRKHQRRRKCRPVALCRPGTEQVGASGADQRPYRCLGRSRRRQRRELQGDRGVGRCPWRCGRCQPGGG